MGPPAWPWGGRFWRQGQRQGARAAWGLAACVSQRPRTVHLAPAGPLTASCFGLFWTGARGCGRRWSGAEWPRELRAVGRRTAGRDRPGTVGSHRGLRSPIAAPLLFTTC